MRRIRAIAMAASVMAATLAAGQARAAYVGLNVTTTGVNVGGVNYGVIRVYAQMSNANDYVTAVFGNSTSTLSIRNTLIDGITPGTGFFNPGGGGSNLAPYQEDVDVNPALQYGTFATIGVSLGDQGSGLAPLAPNETNTSPGFPNFINGTQLVSNDIAWFTAGPVEQGRAGYGGDSDAAMRVMLMQLTVRSGELVSGSINIQGETAGGQVFQTLNQTFFAVAPVPPPTPGTLAALAIGAALGKRRRRTESRRRSWD